MSEEMKPAVSQLLLVQQEGRKESDKPQSFTEENHSAFQVRLTESVTLVTDW